jgi:hypothetical protein
MLEREGLVAVGPHGGHALPDRHRPERHHDRRQCKAGHEQAVAQASRSAGQKRDGEPGRHVACEQERRAASSDTRNRTERKIDPAREHHEELAEGN